MPSPATTTGARQERASAMPSPRFFHAAVAGAPDEAALATWWRRFRDPLLDDLIVDTLRQGYETSAASLRLQQIAERGETDGKPADPFGEEAGLYDFYAVRLRQIATTARLYFQALSLRDRIACTDDAILAGATALRGAAPRGEAEAGGGSDAGLRPSPLADLHAHRIRLRLQWDIAAVTLAHQTALPLETMVARIRDRRLPGASAESPAIGCPETLRQRRPDLLAMDAAVARAAADGTARMAALAREQRQDQALHEVELALAALSAAQAELIPVRAALASAEARYGRCFIDDDVRSILEATCALHMLRDREIETRGRGYLALIDLFHAAGCGWPVFSDSGLRP
jgi:outer membrane protein TolC